MNQIILVGRVASICDGNFRGEKYSQVKLSIPRNYKNADGVYETDIIPVLLGSGSLAENTKEYCKKGDVIGVRGRVESEISSTGALKVFILADKVIFLSAKDVLKSDEEES